MRAGQASRVRDRCSSWWWCVGVGLGAGVPLQASARFRHRVPRQGCGARGPLGASTRQVRRFVELDAGRPDLTTQGRLHVSDGSRRRVRDGVGLVRVVALVAVGMLGACSGSAAPGADELPIPSSGRVVGAVVPRLSAPEAARGRTWMVLLASDHDTRRAFEEVSKVARSQGLPPLEGPSCSVGDSSCSGQSASEDGSTALSVSVAACPRCSAGKSTVRLVSRRSGAPFRTRRIELVTTVTSPGGGTAIGGARLLGSVDLQGECQGGDSSLRIYAVTGDPDRVWAAAVSRAGGGDRGAARSPGARHAGAAGERL
jgi:hypothetical protein